MGKRVKISKKITRDDIMTCCAEIGLDPCSVDPGQVHPMLQTLAAGLAWAAVGKLANSDSIPLFNQLHFSAPLEIGDTITARAHIGRRTKEGYLKIRLLCRNQQGKLVLQGWHLCIPGTSTIPASITGFLNDKKRKKERLFGGARTQQIEDAYANSFP